MLIRYGRFYDDDRKSNGLLVYFGIVVSETQEQYRSQTANKNFESIALRIALFKKKLYHLHILPEIG